ncbi:MSMEG_6728 family protein [Actinokineospora iranica]|uniref:Uncharacterized protein n=1 Tax=Actinokineospora iranica TaxID=1271860 RepID=A0A1G6XFZ6_9PSEU|nr:MSMEG_6728 family protein [Actinokineospora iranica]SDD76116.1 hypothetical protein SAMN05216174_11745 [Actinokineospora iranica]
MQTFLPYPDFVASAAALDRGRLGKQRVEAVQILRALVWPVYGWKHHPAVAMWRGFVPALVLYTAAVCRRWTDLGHADSVLAQALAFTGGRLPEPDRLADEGMLPPWLGEPAVHLSHQASLLRKDPEHYRPLFGDDVPDDLPYAWPSPVYPRWPLRRGHPHALPLPDALDLLGVAPPDAAESAALDDVLAGRGAVLVGADPVRLAEVGLLAGLCTPGRTAWVSPLPLPRVTHPGATPVVGPDYGGGRQPDAAAVAAMRAECLATPDFAFFREGSVNGFSSDVDLVVLDRVRVMVDRPALSLVVGG